MSFVGVTYRNQQLTRMHLLIGGFDTLLISLVATQPPVFLIPKTVEDIPYSLLDNHPKFFCLFQCP
jgi:hypothetical protein